MSDVSKMTAAEVRHKMRDYLNPNTYVNPLAKRTFIKLTAEYPDIAEEALREVCHQEPDSNEKRYVRMEMYKRGRCADLALEDARHITERISFPNSTVQYQTFGYEWTHEHEEMLMRWLLCERNVFPDTVPINEIWQQVGLEQSWRAELIGASSKVCEFPARFSAYALFKGDWDYFKFMLRGVMTALGENGADDFIRHIRLDYIDILKKKHPEITDQIVRFFAVIHTINDGNTRQEQAFYAKWIDRWLIADKEKFMMILAATSDPALRKKMMKKYIHEK